MPGTTVAVVVGILIDLPALGHIAACTAPTGPEDRVATGAVTITASISNTLAALPGYSVVRENMQGEDRGRQRPQCAYFAYQTNCRSAIGCNWQLQLAAASPRC